MNVHERLWKALNHEEADRVPTFTQTIEPEFVARYDREVEMTGECGHMRFDLELAAELGYDSKWVHYGGTKAPKREMPLDVLPEDLKKRIEGKQVSSTDMVHNFNSNGDKWYVDGVLKTPEVIREWLGYLKDFEVRDASYFKQFKKLWDDSIEKGLVPIPTCGGPLYTVWASIGMDRFAYIMRKYSNLFKQLLMRLVKNVIEAHKCYYELGIDMMMTCDDHALKNSSMFNPEQIKEYVEPAYELLAKTAHKYGAKYIVHTDGDYTSEMDSLVTAGVDAVEPLEYEAGMRLKHLKENWGDDLCFIGNVPASDALCVGTVKDTIKHTKKCLLDAGEGGGLILGQSANLLGCSKVENVQAMIDTVKKYGTYPLDTSKLT